MRPGEDPIPDTMTLDEWAVRMGTSLPNAYRQAQRGAIPGLIRIGKRQWRVSRRVVDRVLDGESPLTTVA